MEPAAGGRYTVKKHTYKKALPQARQSFLRTEGSFAHNQTLKTRVSKSLDKCVVKIQHAQSENGSIKGAGWAGVLQSSFATNALESAKAAGADVDEAKLERYKNYQKGNFDTKTNSVATGDGAGVMLYSISGTAHIQHQLFLILYMQ